MSTSVPVAVAEIVTEDNIVWTLEYFLQTYEVEDVNSESKFGVKVAKLHESGTIAEFAESFAITCNFDEAMQVLAYLARGTVPPCVLAEMIDEWYSEKAIRSLAKNNLSPTLHTYHREA